MQMREGSKAITWVKLDDKFHWDGAIAPLSDAAYRLYVGALCYCNWQETDGWLAPNAVDLIAQRIKRTREAAIKELVAAGLWVAELDGFRVKNYLKFQPSKAQLEERRSRMQALGAAGGVASGLKRGASSAAVEPARLSAVVEPRPVPSRPVVSKQAVSDNATSVRAPVETSPPLPADRSHGANRRVVL